MDAWEREAKEPAKWFARFQFYCEHHEKGLDGVYQAYRQMTQGRDARDRAPGSWREAYRRWRWDERARAYLTYQQRLQICQADQERHEKRQLIHKAWKLQMHAALAILTRAQLPQLDPLQAQRLLPTAARLFHNGLLGLPLLPEDRNVPRPEDLPYQIVFQRIGGSKEVDPDPDL